jgi:N-acetylglucosamine kinase-like BadF-type ATPase
VWHELHKHLQGNALEGTVLGLAGVDRSFVRDNWIRRLDQFVVGRYWLVGDYQLAWAAMTHGAPGTVGILGTGSVFYGYNGTQEARLGGYGWQLGDAGSGLLLGQEAVKAALGALDRVSEDTVLVDLVTEFFGAATVNEILAKWYTPPFEMRTVSALAGPVLNAARYDGVAHRIVERQAHRVVRYLERLTHQLGITDVYSVGVAGGLAGLWLPWLTRSWEPLGHRVGLTVISEPPALGAAELARLWHRTGKRSDRHAFA